MDFTSYLKYFFFADGYRTTIMVLLIFGLIFFLSIIYVTWKAHLRFSLIFIVMINAMISGIISPLGYFFNWVIDDPNDSSKRVLLFGESDGFWCQFQAFTLATFQCSRESFVTLIMVISFLKVRFPDMNISSTKINIIVVLFFGYVIPASEVLIFMKLHVWGQSHLFCFTGMVTGEYRDNIVTCGLIHFLYIVVLIIISNLFILDILIRVNRMRKNYIDRNSDPDAGTNGCICCDPLLKKLIFYPLAQIVSMSLPITYRILDWFVKGEHPNPSGPAAIMNAISSFIYTAIFFFSNNYLRQVETNKYDDDEEEIDKVLEMNSDLLSSSTNTNN